MSDISQDSGLQGIQVHVEGIVQGVGFRPFVYSLARRLELTGWVRNTSAGVDIALDGSAAALQAFIAALPVEAPALARIDVLDATARPPDGFTDFEIIESQAVEAAFQPISPDVSICPDCLRELFDPADRRYRYPFINCTNCGPRFTIIQDIPYDRPKTTMAAFPMCPSCEREYRDPLDRRFHAQPVACPECGPQVWLELSVAQSGVPEPVERGDAAIQTVRALLRQGKIVAIKGLGGFHLACDATNPKAVAELRRRKLRVDKPFALMAADRGMVEAHCWVSPLEAALIERRERPIILLRRREDSPVAVEVAPGQNTLGFMLPYTPLHYLLFSAEVDQGGGEPRLDLPPLVMTSANLSEEPICTDNAEARRRLATLADAFLMHDRLIHTRCDDSVARMFPPTLDELTAGGGLKPGAANTLYLMRRARGYAPDPLRLAVDAPPLLAAGAELKNTFCLTRGRYAFLSHHIGDLENYETLQAFEDGVAHFERLFRIQPELIAYDLHPNYMATRYALERAGRENLPAVGVQHHHAHIAACMAENGLSGEQRVIGAAFDGTGYGADGAVWGGEFLLADYRDYQRAYHLKYTLLPGGDRAAREPWRMALAWLHSAGLPWDDDLPPVRHAAEMAARSGIQPTAALRRQLETGLNSPQTSSMGRLFDAVAALAGVRQIVSYEAQAAIELEALASGREPAFYPFQINGGIIDPTPMLAALIDDLRHNVALPVISTRFHAGVARMTLDVCLELRHSHGLNDVALSGGVWQNTFLLALTVGLLQQEKFHVHLHRQAPANDGGLALGQAAVAIAAAAGG